MMDDVGVPRDRTEVHLDISPRLHYWQNCDDGWLLEEYHLKLVRSLLCLEMTRNYEKNTYRVSQKKGPGA